MMMRHDTGAMAAVQAASERVPNRTISDKLVQAAAERLPNRTISDKLVSVD